MARLDLPLDQLVDFRPQVAEPDGFDSFWAATIDAARALPPNVRATPVATPYRTVDVHDVSFSGFAGDPINAWLTTPRHADGPLPAVVEFIGYGGGRDVPGASLSWASAGYAHLLVDTRGQGSAWLTGSTGDPHGSGPHGPGFVTSGIESPDTYYYRRVFTDAVRAVDAVRMLPGVDPARVAVQGLSQGGGITLAVSGLIPDLLAVMPDVPFLCHFRRAVDISDQDPFAEVTRYLAAHRGAVERTFATLSHFDGVNFAKRAAAPALFSVALMDRVCPPSTVYSAYNAYAGAKEIVVYPYNDHEGGGSHQRLAQINWLNERSGIC